VEENDVSARTSELDRIGGRFCQTCDRNFQREHFCQFLKYPGLGKMRFLKREVMGVLPQIYYLFNQSPIIFVFVFCF